ncbi:EF-hand domain-containing protein [Flavisphingomonas formosensis]|uniref:EF-hand domain-containing protein n=1 Tax=Flavisphingomonas formosensis TaxID=861534 RepID=UPI0012FB7F04|nr:EF-hand domain-containing protein [Sphingomonas formosensis]
MRWIVSGIGGVLLLVALGIVVWRTSAVAEGPVPPPPAGVAVASPVAPVPVADPPQAEEKTREEKRFARYDKDKNGQVGREEYLAARRKAFAKLDTNGDGKLDFEEYAVKTTKKFADADADRSGALTPAEFAKTRVVRKASARCACPPPATGKNEEE